jgi:hypothetical protein
VGGHPEQAIDADLVDAYFNMSRIGEGIEQEDIATMFNDHDENGGPDEVEFEKASRTLLYENFKLSNLCATFFILNRCQTHGPPNTFIFELLRLLKNNILPTPNTSPSFEYETSHMLKKLKLACNLIDVCIKRFMLFRGVHANVDHCVHLW